MRHVRLLIAAILSVTACAAPSASDDTTTPGDEQDVTSDAATVKLTADFKTAVTGTPSVGKGLRIEYALERLPECRFESGGRDGWNVTGFFSENGGAAKTFAVTELTPEGKRVAKAARIEPSQGGDIAIWFQVVDTSGCSKFDSQFGQNYHLDVKGDVPSADGSIVFNKDGKPEQTGKLHAGGKVKIRYDQDRLPECHRTERGNPAWTITGFSKIGAQKETTFGTARPDGSDRKEIDAIVDLPEAGQLSLWFQVVSLGGCMKYDSNGGANYTFTIDP